MSAPMSSNNDNAPNDTKTIKKDDGTSNGDNTNPPLSSHDRWQLFYILGFLVISGLGVHLINISAAWYLVSQQGGNTILGVSLAGVSLFIMAFQPYYGMVVDTYNRKYVILWVMGICMTISIATYIAVGTAWQFMFMPLSVAFGMLYYNFTTPCLNSIKQEIFPPKKQRAITYWIETTLSATATLSAIATIVLVQVLDFKQSLVLNTLCLAISCLLFARIQYTKTPFAKTMAQSPIQRIISGLQYTWNRPFFMMHTLIATAPFVLMGTVIFLNPVFLSQVLNAPDESFPIVRTAISLGSFMAGIILQRLMRGWRTRTMVYFSCFGMGIVLLCRTYIDDLILFYIISCFVGFFTSASRIGRMNLMLDHIDDEYTGRVYTSIQSTIMIFRFITITISTALLATLGTGYTLDITWYFTIPMVLLLPLGMRMHEPPRVDKEKNTQTDLGTIKSNAHGTNSL